MGKIEVESCLIEGLKVITPKVFRDERGYFTETYNARDMKEAGIDRVFVQDNQSMSRKGVLRGLHFQKQFPQAKLVRVLQGRVFDVAVDIRKGSKTFGKWFGVELSDEPGNLNKLLQAIEDSFINVNYMYLSFNRESGMPIIILHTEDPMEVESSIAMKGFTIARL